MEQVHGDLPSHHGQKSMASQVMPKRIFQRNETDQKKRLQQNIDCDKKPATDPLDEAMKELLDICQQYNDKLNIKIKDRVDHKNSSKEPIFSPKYRSADKTVQVKQPLSMESPINLDCDMDKRDHDVVKGVATPLSNSKMLTDSLDSIERLQLRQSELQSQLDEVLQTANALASKQKRKLNCILEDDDKESKETLDDDDDELIEFQQIENELRISELNRQLDNIQEELRIRLYKRLLTNTKNGANNKPQLEHSVNGDRVSHIDGSSPCSSSCSEPTSSANSIAFIHSKDVSISSSFRLVLKPAINNSSTMKSTIGTELNNQDNRQLSERSQDINLKNDSEYMIREDLYKDEPGIFKNETPDTGVQSNNLSNIDSPNEYEILTTSKESVDSSKRCPSAELASIYNNINNNSNILSSPAPSTPTVTRSSNVSPTCLSHYRESSANSDLERIEEDEEDCQDYYGNSDHFRTIYEEKLSPAVLGQSILASASAQGSSKPPNACQSYRNVTTRMMHNSKGCSQDHAANITSPLQNQMMLQERTSSFANKHGYRQQQQYFTNGADDCNSSCNETKYSSDSGNSFLNGPYTNDKSKVTNRPLTLYLPKPDEEIDLVDHIQAIGHDLSIISNDIKIDSTSAHGYLWKCCSNNSKKWLRRYFYFDRSSKTLSYFTNEAQLVKRQANPRNSIHFDEISDVYVDHKLSGIGERDRSSKRKNYVFVLSTLARKYLLASSMAETMRAWIDILFTGVTRTDDHFLQMAPPVTIHCAANIASDSNDIVNVVSEGRGDVMGWQ